MGLINNDVYSCANGVQKVGTYISFGTETVYLCQASSDPSVPAADRKYNVRANYRVYWDKDCRNANKPFLDLQSVSTQLSAAHLETNLYGALYEALKVTYPNCSDELVRAAPEVPAVAAADASAPAVADASAPAVADASAPVVAADVPAVAAVAADVPAVAAADASAPVVAAVESAPAVAAEAPADVPADVPAVAAESSESAPAVAADVPAPEPSVAAEAPSETPQ